MVECPCLMLTQLSLAIGKLTVYIVNVQVLFEFLLELSLDQNNFDKNYSDRNAPFKKPNLI